MVNKTINETIKYAVPEEMREMTEEEHKKFFPFSDEQAYGLYNEEKHTLIAAIYKKRPFLVGTMGSEEDILKATEKKLQKQIPTLETVGQEGKMIDQMPRKSFKFQYTVQGIKQVGEYVLCHFSKYDCAFEYITREEYAEFAKQKFDAFLKSISFK